jgi:hypothetical protein
VPDTIWEFELVWHGHQSVCARCVFQSAVCKVRYVLCDEICTNDTTCFLLSKEGKDLAGKCSVVTTALRSLTCVVVCIDNVCVHVFV